MIHEKKSKSIFIFFFCVFFLSFVTVNACSVTALEDEDRLIVARNMDWPEPGTDRIGCYESERD